MVLPLSIFYLNDALYHFLCPLFLLPFSMSQVRKDSSPFASLPKVCTSSPSNSRLLLISPSRFYNKYDALFFEKERGRG